MSEHRIMGGKLLQMDKKYANLKMKQKEKIHLWMKEEIYKFYREQGILPRKDRFEMVINRVYERMQESGIWLPYAELHKQFYGKGNTLCDKVYGQIIKEERSRAKADICIILLKAEFSVCKVKDYSQVDLDADFCFCEKTDEERSLVCKTENVPSNTISREDGWRAFRIKGILEFSLIGILSGITGALAESGIGIFAISTYQTDYVLIKEADFERALTALGKKGYAIGDVS